MRNYLVIILLFVVMLIISSTVYICTLAKNIECFEGTKHIQCVVARYNEDTEWMIREPFDKFDMICYNKGQIIPGNCYEGKCKIVQIDNVGRCDHTYLYHIIENYNNLADVTIFLPASCMDTHKRDLTLSVIKNVMMTQNTVLQGAIMSDVRSELYDFTLDEWKSTNPSNFSINQETKLQLSPIRPFGKWFDAIFGPDLKIKVFCYYSIIAVAREHILQHPLERYQKIIEYLNKSSNPEAGHYVERSWGAIFYPYPNSCIYDVQNINANT